MDTTTIVLPSARAIRYEQLHAQRQLSFLPNYLTMHEFMSNLCLVQDYQVMDEDSRILLLLEASDFSAFSSLQIERNFFTFTKNSSYIFKFFQELSAELYAIEALESADRYAEYEEHISILKELYYRYEKLCKERKVFDRIFLPKLYRFNISYAKRHTRVVIKVDGHLTKFELQLLEQACEYMQLELLFTTTPYNKKMQSLLSDFSLQEGYAYRLSFNDKRILSQEKMSTHHNISSESLSESLLQVAFVKKKVYDFVQKGYKPENIAVILPDESFAPLLRSFDTKGNYNFAMGEPFVNSQLYSTLSASIKAIEQKSQENYHRVQRVGDTVYMKLLSIYSKSLQAFDFLAFLEELSGEFSNKREVKIFLEEVHKFKYILPSLQDLSLKSLMSLFMSRLASRSLDDIRGGKITVMGVLETRSVQFDGVIIVDFNDKHVPKRSDKDMFLNTQIRENANLPTMSDRENLQKHYYAMLINNAKEVAISYVDSSESSASRFLKQLHIQTENRYDEVDYAQLLFQQKKAAKLVEKEIQMPYSFQGVKLSNTRLKTFLTCKRKYYHAYVAHLRGHEIPKDMPQEHEIGNAVHLALKALYSKRNAYDDAQELQHDLAKELDAQKGESELESYLIALQKKRLEAFCEAEIERFAQGWEVWKCEESFEVDFAGIKLIGQIDRIDKRGNEIAVLDYKTGSYTLYNKNNFTEATDFQLEFYYLLASGLGNVSCGFYDLKESQIIPESFLQEKLAVLEANIKDLLTLEEVNFQKCEDLKACQFCEYALMCGR